MRIKLGNPTRLSVIAYATGGKLLCNEDIPITHLSTDSRETKSGDLFIAIKGDRYDGGSFASEAKKKGGYVLSANPLISDVLHPDGRSALLLFSSFFNKNLPYILYRIGITGSVGKTTTKEFLKILLSEHYKTHASEGNLNNEIGMPLSLLSAKKESEILLLEMGMNHPGEISRLSKCLCPDIGIITNVGTAHIGNLGNRKKIAQAKLEILDGMNNGTIIVPDEEPLLANAKNKKTFSDINPKASYHLTLNDKNEISLYKNQKLYTKAKFALSEEHNRKCLLAAASVAMEIGLSPSELSERISLVSRDNTRQSVFYRENLCFYADFYNASEESVFALLNSAKRLWSLRRKSLLLGDILELGEMSDEIHRKIGNAISPEVFNNLFLFGNHIEYLSLGAKEVGFPDDRIFITRESDPEKCAAHIRNNCIDGDIIFMKASRKIRLERVLDCFRK